MSIGSDGGLELGELAGFLRSHPALRAKNEIKLVSEVLDAGSWVHGPGDDGAVVDLGAGRPPVESGADQVIACGEALLPAFVAADPYGAGVAAVLANVNDLAAMGAVPLAIVDTIVGSPELAREALRGMKDACGWYDVVLAGGHLTLHDGAPAVSAFGVGRATAVLSTTNVASGQSLIVAACTTGTMRTDFPFFRSFDERVDKMGDDVRVLASVAASGACVAAKDVSMAGLVGSLAMLLEWSQLGVTLDLERLPCPVGVTDAGLADLLSGVRVLAVLAPRTRERLSLGVPDTWARGGGGRCDRRVRAVGVALGGSPGHRDRPRRSAGSRASPVDPLLEAANGRQALALARQDDAHGLVRESCVDLRLTHGDPAEPSGRT